jgi:hypothetical protein
MSNFPRPITFPQINNALQSVLSGIEQYTQLPSTTTEKTFELKNLLAQFLAHPAIYKLTPAPPATPTTEFGSIQSSLKALSHAVFTLQQKAPTHTKNQAEPNANQRRKGNPNPASPPRTFANIAAAQHTCPSLVMRTDHLWSVPGSRPRLEYLTNLFNEALESSPHHQIHIASTKWTANSNIIITGGHMTTAHQLQSTSHILAKALSEDQSDAVNTIPPPQTRPNVKWAKILINGIPTGVQSNRGTAYSPDECHSSLASENPSYASLFVTQKPSWVRNPSTYTVGSSSSLVVAFEDPDGS